MSKVATETQRNTEKNITSSVILLGFDADSFVACSGNIKISWLIPSSESPEFHPIVHIHH